MGLRPRKRAFATQMGLRPRKRATLLTPGNAGSPAFPRPIRKNREPPANPASSTSPSRGRGTRPPPLSLPGFRTTPAALTHELPRAHFSHRRDALARAKRRRGRGESPPHPAQLAHRRVSRRVRTERRRPSAIWCQAHPAASARPQIAGHRRSWFQYVEGLPELLRPIPANSPISGWRIDGQAAGADSPIGDWRI